MNIKDKHKVIAMYLPQYYEIKENNEWWGKGYTDWVAVRNAEKEYKFHIQPKKPLDNNYYDLSKVDSLKWQASLMHKFGLDGMCFYHYYFENGKKILEKPAELLLKNKDIDIPFCFCWANESWVSTWSNIGEENVWSYKFGDVDSQGRKYLMKQEYGDYDDWEEHFNYLLDFFKDERYIKIDNKPVFFIYKSDLIECLPEMVKCWKSLAKKNKFDGVYIIAGNSIKEESEVVDAFYIHEPLTSKNNIASCKNLGEPTLIDYDDLWRKILSTPAKKQQTIFGGFVGYDDTPRHGDKGTVVFSQNAGSFSKYLAELIAKNIVHESPFTLINAWNEWGEGMYLEPDEENGYDFLKAISYAKEHYNEYLLKYQVLKDYKLVTAEENISLGLSKQEAFINVLDNWVEMIDKGEKLESILQSKGYRSVCIYGYGKVGQHIYKQLENTDLVIDFIIDNGTKETSINGISVYKTGDELPDSDVIIVALSYKPEKIIDELKQQYGDRFNIISIQELLN